MKYYIAKVKVVMTDDKGRQKNISEQYCVNAVSVTDAETTDVYVNFKDGVDAYINIQLTKSFLNKQKNTDG